MRVPAAICLVLLVSATGCMPSRKLPAGALDEYWYLHADTWPQARRESLQLAGRTLPTRWVFRQEPSLIWSTVSMVRAIDALKVGTDDFEMAVSPTHAEMLARVLAQFRGTLEGLRDIAEPDEPRSPRRWASAVAGALVSTEEVVRLAVERERPGARKGRDEALGWSAGPVIQMLAAYLDERTGGDLLAGMGGGIDPEGLAVSLERLASDVAKRESLSRKAAERATLFDIEKTVDGTVDVYRKVLAG